MDIIMSNQLEKMINAQFEKLQTKITQATIGPSIAVIKKVVKNSGSEGGFKPVLSRKKKKNITLKESIGSRKVPTKNSEIDDTTESESIDMEKKCLVEETSFDYDMKGIIFDGDHDNMPKEPSVKTTKALGKPLLQMFLWGVE
ncbi:hypothetical protein G9A89_010133 [Geosiphon pyriformis]|nr:hypothetical protein G9A89_010133 [Geosiphon pyriformis]